MNDDRVESERIALEQHYELLRHYSSRLFNAWVSAVTVYLLLWALILRLDGEDGPVSTPAPGLPGDLLVVGGGMALVALIYLMSNGYYRKYLLVLRGGRSLEERLFSKDVGRKLFFSNYPSMAHWAVYVFQIVSVLVLGVYAVGLTSRWWMTVLLVALVVSILFSGIRLEKFIRKELRR